METAEDPVAVLMGPPVFPFGTTRLDTIVSRHDDGATMPDREQIGAFVRRRRRANGMTQRELAELAGVGTRFVSELEREKPTVRLDAVNAILAVFGATVGVVEMPRAPLELDDPDWDEEVP